MLAPAMSNGALALMALAIKRHAAVSVNYRVLDKSWTEVFDLPKANDDVMDMTMRILISRCLHLPPEY
jgi:hypothetical protein